MKLYINRDTHNVSARFVVYDDLYREKYTVTADKKSFKRLKITTSDGKTAVKILQLPLPIVQVYSISDFKRNIKFTVKPSGFCADAGFYGVSWHIRGNILSKSFDIDDADNSIIAVHSCAFEKNCCMLEIMNPENELFCLASAVCANLVSVTGEKELRPT